MPLTYDSLPKDENGFPVGRYRVRIGKTNEPWQGVAFKDGVGLTGGRALRNLRMSFTDQLVIEERIDVKAKPAEPIATPRVLPMPPRKRRT